MTIKKLFFFLCYSAIFIFFVIFCYQFVRWKLSIYKDDSSFGEYPFLALSLFFCTFVVAIFNK